MSERKHILVVDDEPDLLELIALELEFAGAQVKSASGYDSAVRLLENESFDFVISDIRMPGKGGMELLAYCQQHHPDMGVILMTGYAEVTVEIALHAGAIARLDKPFSRDDLGHALQAFAVDGVWQLPLEKQPEFGITLTGSEVQSIAWGRGGFRFLTSSTLPDVGTCVAFSITAPEQESPFEGDGIIRWLRLTEKGTYCGISFGTVDFACAKKLISGSERISKTAFIPSPK